MFSTIVIVILIYLLYDYIKLLAAFEGPYGLAEWGMVVLCILFVPAIIFSGIRAWKNYKNSNEKRAEEQKKQASEQEQRKRRFYLDEEDEQPIVSRYDESNDEDADAENRGNNIIEAEVVNEYFDADEEE